MNCDFWFSSNFYITFQKKEKREDTAPWEVDQNQNSFLTNLLKAPTFLGFIVSLQIDRASWLDEV